MLGLKNIRDNQIILTFAGESIEWGAMRQIKGGVICILISIVMCWSASAANNKRYVNIVFIGNSITFGAGLPKPVHDAPPVKAALF